jgi:SnoaL-like domain
MNATTDTHLRTVVEDYIAVWNEPDGERRRAIIARTFTEDAGYLDPMMSGAGHDGIDTMVAAAQRQFPGHRFVLADGPDGHHDRARFTWHLVADGHDVPAAVGTDFATVAEDGRLRAVTGFLEAVA